MFYPSFANHRTTNQPPNQDIGQFYGEKTLCSVICTSLCSSSVVTLKMPCFFLSSAIWFGLLLGQLMVHGSKMSKKGYGNMKERLRDCWNYVPLRNYFTIKHSYWISLEISMRQSIRQLKKILRKELISISLNTIPDLQITKAIVLEYERTLGKKSDKNRIKF